MSLNKALVVGFCVLNLLVVVTVFNLNRSKSAPLLVHDTDDEALLLNICLTPEIVRSYEKVKDVYGQKNTMVFRFVSSSCNSCLDSQLNALLTFQEEIGKAHIWVFPAYPDDRNSMIRLSAELAKFKYRNIPADSLLIPTYEGELRSYFAWIDSNGDMAMVFVPDRSNVRYTRQFFLEVKRRIE